MGEEKLGTGEKKLGTEGEVGDGERRSWGQEEELMMEGGEIENEDRKFSSV